MKTILNNSKAIPMIACMCMLSFSMVYAAPNWQQQRYGAVGFSIGDKGYIGTGYGYVKNVFGLKKDFWEYNPATDSWTQKADFGGAARQYAVGFSIGTKGYIGTGVTSGSVAVKDFWEYNPATNKWVKKNDFGGVARGCAVGFSISNKGYIGTGQGNKINLKDFWEYNPATGLWVQIADFPGIARYAAAGFSIGSKGYIGTGINYVSSTEFTWFSDFYEYDPGTGVWLSKASIGGPARAFAVGFCISNKGYIGTGNSSLGLRRDYWEYDPGNDTWLQKADLGGVQRSAAIGFGIGLKGYIGTGLESTSSFLQDLWEYNQSTNSWTRKKDLGNKTKVTIPDTEVAKEISLVSNLDLAVYPNPSKSTFNFKFETESSELVTIQLFDLSGRLVQEYNSLSPDDVITIGSELKAGIYVASVTQGLKKKQIKIIKTN